MCLSSGELMVGVVEGAVAEHGEEDVAPSPGEGDEGLVMAFALGDFALSNRPIATGDDRKRATAEAAAAAQTARDVATALTVERAAPRAPTTRTPLDVMREANRAEAQQQQESQRKAG